MTSDPRKSPNLSHLTWLQMPQDGGQIVSVTYACDETYLYCCSHDRSDNTYSIERAEWDHDTSEDDCRFEPWNGLLPKLSGDWEEIAEETTLESMADAIRNTTEAIETIAGGPDSVYSTAQEWIDAGFTVEQAKAWWAVGGFDAERCEELHDAGLTPEECGKDVPDGEWSSTKSWAYAFSNGDVEIGDVIENCKE